jgi:hypothetical protein
MIKIYGITTSTPEFIPYIPTPIPYYHLFRSKKKTRRRKIRNKDL